MSVYRSLCHLYIGLFYDKETYEMNCCRLSLMKYKSTSTSVYWSLCHLHIGLFYDKET